MYPIHKSLRTLVADKRGALTTEYVVLVGVDVRVRALAPRRHRDHAHVHPRRVLAEAEELDVAELHAPARGHDHRMVGLHPAILLDPVRRCPPRS